MITLKYLGKKGPFTLSLPFLSRSYYIEGPDATVDFTNADATQMMSSNPKMFRVEGIKTEDTAPPEPPVTKVTVAPTKITFQPKVKELDPLPDKWDKIEAKDNGPLVLTGDGVDGEADEVPISVLMTYTAEELRTYAMQRFAHQFTEDDKRNQMIKKIKELEQKKAQAAI